MSIVFGSDEAQAIARRNAALQREYDNADDFEVEHGCTLDSKLRPLLDDIEELRGLLNHQERALERYRTRFPMLVQQCVEERLKNEHAG